MVGGATPAVPAVLAVPAVATLTLTLVRGPKEGVVPVPTKSRPVTCHRHDGGTAADDHE